MECLGTLGQGHGGNLVAVAGRKGAGKQLNPGMTKEINQLET